MSDGWSIGGVSIPSQDFSRLGLALLFVGTRNPGGDGRRHPLTVDPPSRGQDGSPDPMGPSVRA